MKFHDDDHSDEGTMALGCALCIGFGLVFLATIACIAAVTWRVVKWGFEL